MSDWYWDGVQWINMTNDEHPEEGCVLCMAGEPMRHQPEYSA